MQGKDAIQFLEKLVVGDVQSLADGTGSLSVMLNESGGIIDDTVITKVTPTEIYMVLNAGCADKDLAHINTQLAQQTGDVQLTVHDDRSLLALQGPKAVSCLQPLIETDLSKVYFSHFRQGLTIAGVRDCFLTRTGCVARFATGCQLHVLNKLHCSGHLQPPLYTAVCCFGSLLQLTNITWREYAAYPA